MNTDFSKKLNDLMMTCGSSTACRSMQPLIENLINSVQLDEKQFIAKLEEALADKTGDDLNVFQNILNCILDLFGLNRLPKNLKERLGKEEGLHNFLDIDMIRAAQQIAGITEIVASLEASDAAKAGRINQLEGLLADANRSIDKLRLERDMLLKERAAKENDMLHAFQRMIARKPGPADDAEADPMAAYLEDQGITWSWDDAENPEDFTAYMVSDESLTGVRLPCLYRGDTVAVKGLKYILKH